METGDLRMGGVSRAECAFACTQHTILTLVSLLVDPRVVKWAFSGVGCALGNQDSSFGCEFLASVVGLSGAE